ncbi:MAG: hypothetical protein ACI9MR_003395 [Myxococcota bacterium]|jgi:hypothetical protein
MCGAFFAGGGIPAQNHSMKTLASLLLVSVLLSAPACWGGDDDAETKKAVPAFVPAPIAFEMPAAHPETEDGLVDAFTQAIKRRDVVALKRLTSPELGADLHRMHAQDAESFWGRGTRWIQRIDSGVQVALVQANHSQRYRVLLKFGTGEEETVVMGQHNRKLVFMEL